MWRSVACRAGALEIAATPLSGVEALTTSKRKNTWGHLGQLAMRPSCSPISRDLIYSNIDTFIVSA
jgi:hypothetical protein